MGLPPTRADVGAASRKVFSLPKTMTQKILPTSIALMVFLLVLGPFLKVYMNASAELEIARSLAAKNKPEKAVPHFERSIQWFVPGSDMPEQAASGLWAIAEAYEQSDRLEEALAAFRLLRSAFYSARSFYTPGQRWIERSNEKIAVLMARLPAQSQAEAEQTFEERKERALKALTVDKQPHASGAFLAEAGFFGWVAAAFLFIFRAITPAGRLRAQPALVWGLAFAACYGIWIFGMFKA